MLDIKFVRENPDKVKEEIKKRNMKIDFNAFLVLDAEKRKLQQEIEELRKKQNEANKIISKKKDQKILAEMKEIKTRLSEDEPKLKEMERKLEETMLQFPNITHESVPVGPDESGNIVVRKWGEKPEFDFKPKDHVEIGEALDVIDIKRATKVTGARFNYLKNEAVMIEIALLQFVFKALTDIEVIEKIADSVERDYSDKPFVPVFPPVMIKPEVFRRMARLSEQDKDERYYLPQDDLYLIGSAEHTLGSIHIDETIGEANLPIRYLGFSTSFRREAGSYGKDTRGILRVHQFDKIEMESFTSAENSFTEHKFFVAVQEYLVQALKIPYQVVQICTGDMGKPDAHQTDIECWMPGQGKYRETHTADLMTDFQSRRLNTRVKRKSGKTELVHTNDATAFAIGRILIAIIENYQQKDGSVVVPEVLRKWVGKDVIK